jgi:hypothetical protein
MHRRRESFSTIPPFSTRAKTPCMPKKLGLCRVGSVAVPRGLKPFSLRGNAWVHDTYASVARMTSIKIICAIAAHLGLKLEQIDVETAYLHGKINSKVYLHQPPVFVDPKHSYKVLELIGNLYEFKQAAKIWNEKFHQALLQIGLRQVSVDPCIYITISRNRILIIGIHVDDCLTAETDQLLQTFKKELRKHFPIKEMGFSNALLGTNSHIQGKPSLSINQHT